MYFCFVFLIPFFLLLSSETPVSFQQPGLTSDLVFSSFDAQRLQPPPSPTAATSIRQHVIMSTTEKKLTLRRDLGFQSQAVKEKC